MSDTLNKTSFGEVFIQFQIQVKRTEIQDYNEEMRQLEDKKQRLMKLKDQLKQEQYGHVCKLHEQIKEQERNLEHKELWNKEQVEHTVEENLKLKHKQENELKELHSKLARMQVQMQMDELQEERKEWLKFKNKDSVENQQRIQKLETHISASEKTYQEMSEYFQRSLTSAVEDTDRKTEQRYDEIIQLSKQKAKTNLDNYSKKQLKDNDWLKQEVANYGKKIIVLESTVQILEAENLKLVNELLIHPSDDPMNSSSKTLGSPDMHSMNETIMQICHETSPESANRPSEEAEKDRQETPPDLREIFMGPIHLDSLKQKLLCVVGEAVPLHQPASEPTDAREEMDPGPSQNKDSVLTLEIIQKKLQELHTSDES